MKKMIIPACLCATLSGGGTIEANAATKCVAFNGTTECYSGTSYGPSLEWEALCLTGGIAVNVFGVAMCSSYGFTSGSGEHIMPTIKVINSSSDPIDEIVYCWCKMTNPVVSKWVYAANLPTGSKCVDQCGALCAQKLESNTATFMGNVDNSPVLE